MQRYKYYVKKQNEVPDFLAVSLKIKSDAARMAATEAQKFFKNCFVKGGFTDATFQKWTDRKSPLGGKKTLYNDGNLMHSIRPTTQSESRVVISSSTAYSELHNNGGMIMVTAKMKKFWWAKYYEFSGKVKKMRNGRASNSANKSANTKADFCRRMALMKVGSKIKIPQRQFIGESQTLMNQFEDWFKNEIEVQFKK